MASLDGRVAVVTGAGRGLGSAHARQLATEGALVVVNDPGGDWGGASPDTRPAQQVVEEIKKAGGEAVANFDNCADWSGAQRLIDQAVETYGRLDILVNNAGILRDKMSFNMAEDDWDSVIDVHLKGHFAPAHFAASHWRARIKAGDEVYGRIINTTSESGLFGLPGQANYAAAKSGIIAMTWVLARELERLGVTVNAIAPRARTRMTAKTFDGFGEPSAGQFDEWAPENVSPFVAWLASPLAADVSGQVFVVWSSEVQLVGGFQVLSTIDAGKQRWTVDTLDASAAQLFGSRSRGLPPIGTPEVVTS